MTNDVSFKSKKSYYLRKVRQRHFIHSPWSGGVVLVIFAAIALILANLPWTKEAYHHILTSNFTFGFDSLNITRSLEQWINDGLMVIFFFVVGLEIKREIIAGQLSSIKQASLPIAAAIGGMIVPAIIYALFNQSTQYEPGWGIPMATDIAFAIGVLSLLGNRVPLSMKIFLTALAIVDDLGAILVIAIFYTAEIDFVMLGAAGVVLVFLLIMNNRNIYQMRYYLIPSVLLWILFLHSGIHATIAGVLIAMTIPSTPRFNKKYFLYKSKYFIEDFRFHNKEGIEVLANDDQLHDLNAVQHIAANAISPTQRLEHVLNPFVTFFIMPVFALANAGVTMSSVSELHVLGSTQGAGIFFGLVLGKPVGIILLCWLTIKLGLAVMPKGADWKIISGVACLGGVGFTMSIFIDNLAFAGTPFIDSGKIAVLIASLTSAILGVLVINMLANKHK